MDHVLSISKAVEQQCGEGPLPGLLLTHKPSPELTINQFFRFKPQADFFINTLHQVAAMNHVPAKLDAEVSNNGAQLRVCRVDLPKYHLPYLPYLHFNPSQIMSTMGSEFSLGKNRVFQHSAMYIEKKRIREKEERNIICSL